MKAITEFLSELYYLVSEMAPYLLLGFFFAGLLKAFMPQKGVSKFLGKKSFRSISNAALLGVPMPLCSCGVIPTGVSLFRNGASKGATTSFLISTPQTGVDSILATYSLLGLPFAVLRPIVAFVSGLIGGGLNHAFVKDQEGSASVDNHKGSGTTTSSNGSAKSLPQRMKLVISYGFGELVEDIVKWLVIGLLAAALISVLIPEQFFSQYIGNGLIEMLIILAVSIPMYICATGSIPMAAVLLMKGLSPGAALVLLMAGPATNIATISVIGKVLGRKSLLIYLFSIMGGALGFGLLVNAFLPTSWFLMPLEAIHHNGMLPGWLTLSATILLTAIIILAAYRKWFMRSIEKTNNNNLSDMLTKIHVEGMTCNHCKASVENNLGNLPGVSEVSANLQDGIVSIDGKVDLTVVERVVNDLGYQYKGAEV